MSKQQCSSGVWAVALIVLILLIDQVVKIWIKTHMQIGESVQVTSWFYIYFIENNGMAFGMEIVSKLFLTIFRLVACGLIAFFIYKQVKKKAPLGYILCLAAIWAGAFGNIIDSVFYGVLFDDSLGQVATFLPEGGGYAPWFHGKVVDMLYFPLVETVLPKWIPFWGGEDFVFFRPIFNIADSAITCGVAALLLFHRKQIAD